MSLALVSFRLVMETASDMRWFWHSQQVGVVFM